MKFLDKNGNEIRVGDKITYKNEEFKVEQLGGSCINMVWAKFTRNRDLTWVSGGDVELVNTSPVRKTTIVKKEIVPGTYGDVRVLTLSDTKKVYVEFYQSLNKLRLAEALKTLQLIHDAME